MENRAFNFVCVVTFFLLLICISIDIYISQTIMTTVMLLLMLPLGLVYYLSRYRKIYKIGVTMFAIFSYAVLSLNFFMNDGSSGPTIYLFFVTLIFLITLGNHKHHFVWITLHTVIVATLLVIEYNYPSLIPGTYPDRAARYLDLAVTYAIAVSFLFAITNYLRGYYYRKARLADERSLAIIKQNEQISAQNTELETVNQEKNKLFSIISHDLRSPLDSIRGYLELMSNNVLDEDEKNKIQEELLVQTKYTTDLLMNLMSWAKTQMHGVTVHLVPQNLKAFVEEVAGNKRSIAARKGIKLTYSIHPDLEVVCDKDMLHIVLRNLVNNAIKFTNEGGEVAIRVTTTTDRAFLSVQDTGIGISAEQQADLFTLKTRSTYGTNREKGIGLGLLMCKEFMDYQRGDIWFESTPGKGSTFFVSLPLTRH
ncbi:HAMP domain-containing sensor histidine kinase [Nemorincola caseinilytica]